VNAVIAGIDRDAGALRQRQARRQYRIAERDADIDRRNPDQQAEKDEENAAHSWHHRFRLRRNSGERGWVWAMNL
jgi:hypothetical protein